MPESKRLFFAIELPTTIQRQIVRWRADCFPPEAGRPVAAANLHLTLAFLGDVSTEKQRALAAMAGRIAQPEFTLHLDDAGQWPRSRVVWLDAGQIRQDGATKAVCQAYLDALLSSDGAVRPLAPPAPVTAAAPDGRAGTPHGGRVRPGTREGLHLQVHR